MKKTINLIMMIFMIAIGIGLAVAEAYYIIIKDVFGLNVLKYALCGFVCYIVFRLVCFLLSIFIKDNKNYKSYEDYKDSTKYKIRDIAENIHIITFIITSIIMVVFFVEGGTKILGLILILFFTMILPISFKSITSLPSVEEKIIGSIYNNKGKKIGEIRK